MNQLKTFGFRGEGSSIIPASFTPHLRKSLVKLQFSNIFLHFFLSKKPWLLLQMNLWYKSFQDTIYQRIHLKGFGG
jgi:hypothetical protein